MSRYRVEYAPVAASSRNALRADIRTRLDRAVDRLADDPYGGSQAISSSEPDRRQALAGDCLIVFYVSRGILQITVVRLQGPP
ncbi:type II toxin-antitoxin system RelE family toxin [Embleya hyalina]|uniref:Type II toxin-antitoxin system RelE/ParE family toxin n=1 Tax=Embleya hyalina TaxID=516124 RepID=A0A401Z405_9ACTN|nr:hypothetical protein [Embleya hyalina]GCE01579.1 hypothetical protein EHYA_09345 [Embleya hyalina]